MKIHWRKFMAVLCTLSILLSCVVIAGFTVSAGISSSNPLEANYDTEIKDSNTNAAIYSARGSSANNTNNASMAAYPTVYQGATVYPADEAHGHAMRLAFKDGATDLVSGDGNKIAGFRVFDQDDTSNNGSRLETGKNYYFISFEYLVQDIPEGLDRPITLDVFIKTLDWSQNNATYYGSTNDMAANVVGSVALTERTTEWQTYTCFTNHTTGWDVPANIVLSPNGNGNAAAGTQVLVDNVTVVRGGENSTEAGAKYITTHYVDGNNASDVQGAYRGRVGDPLPNLITDYSNGKVFDGWYSDGTYTTRVTTITDRTTALYAKWKDVEKKYSFSYDLNGATSYDQTVLSQKAVAGTDVIAPPTNMYREGYTFAGWQVDGNEWTYEAGVTKVPAKDTVVTAVWQMDETVAPVNEGTWTVESTASVTASTTWPVAVSDKENHTPGGSKSVALTVNANALADSTKHRERPKVVLQKDGANFIAELNKSYTISFWAKTNAKETLSSYNFYIAGGPAKPIAGSGAITNDLNATYHTMGWAELKPMYISSNPTTFEHKTSQMDSSDTVSSYVRNLELSPNEWTRIVVNIPAFSGKGVTDGMTLLLGVSDASIPTGTKYGPFNIDPDWYDRTIFVDDVEITENVAQSGDIQDNVNDYQSFEYMSQAGDADILGLSGISARVVKDAAYDGSQSLKITQTNFAPSSGNRAQIVMRDDAGLPIQVNNQKLYMVSFYAKKGEDCAPEVQLMPFVNPVVHSAYNSKYNAQADLYSPQVFMYNSAGMAFASTTDANGWANYSFVTSVGATARDGTAVFGIALRNGSTPVSGSVYIDCLSIIPLDEALSKPAVTEGDPESGNVGLYAKDGNPLYTKAGKETPRAAYRYLAGYATTDQGKNIQLGGATYSVFGRGILVGKANATADDMKVVLKADSLTDAGLTKVNTTALSANVAGVIHVNGDALTNYWDEKDGRIRYGILMQDFTAATADTEYCFRSYVVIRKNNVYSVLYGDVVSNLTLNEVAAACGSSDPFGATS